MKKLFLLFLLFNFVLAQEFPAQKLPPNIRCGENFFACLAFFFDKILKVTLTLALVLATIFIAWAGILYITSGSGGEKGKEIHKRIVWAAIGLIVALMSYAFIKSLEIWVSRIEQSGAPSGPLEPPPSQRPWILPYFPNFVLAEVAEPKIPENISCGGITLPSVFQRTDLAKDIWQTCLLYYLTRILSLLYILSLFLGVIFLSLAGISYITKPEKVQETHKRLVWGIAGVVISILSLTIVKMIEVFFLKL